ncbi:MAG: hypothetical protein ACTSWD_08380 [Candidatus Heimdallarchaeota archaeon]
MLKFNRDKKKLIKFKMEIEGIESNLLEYYIRLSGDLIDYGFKGSAAGGVLEFNIPALGGLLTETEIKNLKSVKIEVHDKQNKYYLCPFMDEVIFETAPKAIAKMDEEKDIKRDIKINLKDIKTNEPVKTSSKLSGFLEK